MYTSSVICLYIELKRSSLQSEVPVCRCPASPVLGTGGTPAPCPRSTDSVGRGERSVKWVTATGGRPNSPAGAPIWAAPLVEGREADSHLAVPCRLDPRRFAESTLGAFFCVLFFLFQKNKKNECVCKGVEKDFLNVVFHVSLNKSCFEETVDTV